MRPAYLKIAVCLALSAALAQPALAEWRYRTTDDKMRGTSTNFAQVESNNQVNFGFPYEGGSRMTLVLRQRANDLNVMLVIDPGQFNCLMDCSVAVKFDTGPVQRFGAVGSDSGSAHMIFLNSERAFVQKLKVAKRIIVEAPFFQYGKQQFEFDVPGLAWPPKTGK